MSSYWVNFARTGNPNEKGLPVWPAVNEKSPVTIELGDKFAPIPAAGKEKFEFIKQYFLTQKPW
jgi:para-nitrobenzyl esterase